MISLFDEGPFAPCPAPFNMAAHVLQASVKSPDKDALLVVGAQLIENWSYDRLRKAIMGTATGLLQQGLSPGDIVLMRLGNTVDFPIVLLGALAAGLVPVPTSAALTAPETAFVIETVQPKLVLRDPQVACAEGQNEIGLEKLRNWRNLPASSFDLGDPNRLGYIIFTSGTAGKPRAVAHAHRAIWARQMMFEDWYGLREDDRVLHAGAFNWTYTLGTGLMDPWTKGATAIIPAPGTASEDLPGLLRKHNATIFAAAPGVYRQMLKRADCGGLSSLRHGLSAGEAMSPELARKWREATGRDVLQAYGMTECSTFISQRPCRESDPASMGTPQRGRRVAIVNDGAPVARGTEGTIAISRRDPGLMLEYVGAAEETENRMSGEWFLTGDQAVMEESGDMIYMGRNDDMMNAGGYRVSPLEVESVLGRLDGIEDVAVTDVEVKENTTVIAAFYTGPVALDDEVLQQHVSGELARYKHPRMFVHLPDLPVGANGKILRRELRNRFKRQE